MCLGLPSLCGGMCEYGSSLNMQLTQYIGITAGIFTASSLLPQLIKIIREKKAQDISYVMLFILLAGLALWIWYGFLREDFPLIATNLFSFVVNLLIIGFTMRYKRK
jgi:MtN3 and saliva related transmembrane protein